MKFIGTAKAIGESILNTFKSGNIVEPLAQVFFQSIDYPSSGYSFGNKFLIALTSLVRNAPYTGAGSFSFWKSKNRYIKSGEKAVYILAPLIRKYEEEKNGKIEIKTFAYGFKSVPVFAVEQTDGEPIPEMEDREDFLRNLPFKDVAEAWGVSVDVAHHPYALGYYAPYQHRIGLSVKNKSTWAHELIHSAEDRLGKLKIETPDPADEIVAELGGAVLLSIIGDNTGADIGGCWEYIQKFSNGDVISEAMALLDRTCRAVQLVVDTARGIQEKQVCPDCGEPLETRIVDFDESSLFCPNFCEVPF